LSFVRVLNDMGADRPPLVLVDNVPGFLTSKSGANLLAALEALNALGYATDIFTLDAVHFVPQSRNRLFIVGRPPGDGDGTRPAPLRSFIEAHPHVRWAIRRLPDPPEPSAKLADILDRDAEWWERPRSEYLLSQMAPSRRAAADQAIRKRRWTFGTVFRRIRNGRTAAELRLDGIAGCLCTPRGGSARQIVFRAGYGRFDVRSLNPRECARLMGAPDYTIDVPANQAIFGLGDAVCVPAIEWIVEHYLTPLCNELIHGRVLVR
jgi:DNA (cytosine-5)-methyltransferase 1